MIRSILAIALILLAGCIDPLDFQNKEQQKHLVVEGSFTNEPELNSVRLTYSQPYSYPYSEYVTDAQVYITSSEGERYEFVYGGDGGNFYDNTAGNYYPESPQEAAGTVGHTYTLHVVVDGKTYLSRPTTLKNPVPIDSVHFELDEQQYAFPGYLEKKMRPGYRVLVNYKDPTGERNFLRWTFESTYEVETQPRDYIDSLQRPAPKRCCVQCIIKEKPANFKVLGDD